MAIKKKFGRITIPPFVYPERHELETASFFASLGRDIEFLAPSRTKGSKTPDVKMDGVLWEIKTPAGKSKNTIFNALRRGVKQSKYIIIDLRLTSIPDDQAERHLRLSIAKVKSIKKVIVITKLLTIVELK